MFWRVNPRVGKTLDWRAGCGRSARPVRREGARNPMRAPYPYLSPGQASEASAALGRRAHAPSLKGWEIGKTGRVLVSLSPSD